MKRVLRTFIGTLAMAAAACAASWDGTYDDLTVSTETYPTTYPVPGYPQQGFALWLTSTNPKVMGFRVTVAVKRADGRVETLTQTVGVHTPYPLASVYFSVDVADVVGSPSVVELVDAEAVSLK